MALILPHSIFLHVPKTGGTWVRHLLLSLNIPHRETHRGDHDPGFGPIDSIHDIPIHDRSWYENTAKWCFVRHPLAWYRSYFAYRQKYPWEPKAIELDKLCQSNNFQEFIEKAIRFYPGGYVCKLYNSFARRCDFVGKQEDLETYVMAFLKKTGDLSDTPTPAELVLPAPVNVGCCENLTFGEWQIDRIYEIDHEAYEKFNYHKELP